MKTNLRKFISYCFLLFLFIFENLLAQVKIINKKLDSKSFYYEIEVENSLSKNLDNQQRKKNNLFGFFDESKSGEYSLPSNDIFLAIPVDSNPKVSEKILEKIYIKGVPQINPSVTKLDNEVKYEIPETFIPSKNKFIEVLGKLWIGNNYCLHIKINPFSVSSINQVEFINKFSLLIDFKTPIRLTYNNVDEVSNKILDEEIAEKIQDKAVFDLNHSDNWIDYSKKYLKLGVNKDGIYRIYPENLNSSGIDVGSINPKTFQIILKGNEIPIYVSGESDLSFDSEDYIEFIGIRNMGGNHRKVSGYNEPYNEYLDRYSDTTIYWLTWNISEGKRVSSINSEIKSNIDTLDYYSQVEHLEKDNWFDFSCDSQVRREMPFWIENKTWVDGQLHVGKVSKNFNLTKVYPDKNCNIFAKLQDYASDVYENAHHLAIGINSNGFYYDSTFINKYEKIVLSAEFNSNQLKEGTNSLQVYSFATNASINSCATDWYEIEYPRYIIPIENNLTFSFPFVESLSEKNIKIQNILSNQYSLWKYGENYKKYNVSINVNEFVFCDTINVNDKFVLMDVTNINVPKIYYTKQFKNLRSNDNQADYIAITHKDFIEQVNEYADLIGNNYGLKTKVIDINDIYDEFSFGYFNPESIKEFLKSAHYFWKDNKPEYVVLIGGATYDYYGNKYNNFSSVTNRVINYVPSFGAPVSDNWFVTWDTTGAYVPQMKIGRIPVTSNEEFRWYLEKHQNYVNQNYDEWNKRYLFFTGGNPTKPNEMQSLIDVNQFIIDNYVTPSPIGGKVTHFMKTIDPVTNFGDYSYYEFQNIIDSGAVIISYLGHSGTQTWDNSITDPSQLKNTRNRFPIISDFGCSTGKFAEPDVISFSQLSTLSKDGQALAYFGNSSLGFLSTSLAMPKLFYKNIFDEGIYNISQAHNDSKLELLLTYGSSDVYKLFALTNSLIGDPILALPIPDKPNFNLLLENISINSDYLSDSQDSVQIQAKMLNLGKVVNDTLEVKVIHEYNTESDTTVIQRKIPLYEDLITLKIKIKNSPGLHNVKIIADPFNKFDELVENDNEIQWSFSVASSNIRPLLATQIQNGISDYIVFLNPSNKPIDEKLLVKCSKRNDFANSTIQEIEFDTIVTKYKFTEITDSERLWIQTKLQSDNTFSIPYSFTKSNYNYYLSDSISFSQNSQSSVKYDNALRIDSIRNKIELLSAGYNDGKTALILKNGSNLIPENTLRGHHICTFSKSSLEFVEYKYFDLLNGGSETVSNYITFLDSLSDDKYIAITISDDGQVSDQNLREKLKFFGSKLIDSLEFRGSWAFWGYKNADSNSVIEKVSSPGSGNVNIIKNISFLSNSGTMLTTEIGPSGKWKILKVEQETPSNSSLKYTSIGIKEDGSLDTLAILTVLDSVVDLSHINSEIYPKLKILTELNSSSDKQSPILHSMRVDYDLLPELAINYQVVSIEKDTVQQGEDANLQFYVYNVGESTADSFKVKVEVIKTDNSKEQVYETMIDSLGSEKRQKFNITYNTKNFNGARTFAISIDGENKVTELYEDNNYFNIPFYVVGDTTQPSLKLTFDGNDIFDGEYISATPKIKIELNDPSLVPITDTTSVSLYLNNHYINYAGNENLLNVSFSESNPKVTVNYSPTLEDGEYTLRIFGKDASGNVADSSGIRKSFIVKNDPQLLNVYNYPNPVSSDTYFTFKLTQIPDDIKIKVFTIAGRLIKEIELNSSQLNYDLNKIYWDGRDEDGDLIGNGVYLYKVIMNVAGKKQDITQKLAVVR